jgi:hypothetical protein
LFLFYLGERALVLTAAALIKDLGAEHSAQTGEHFGVVELVPLIQFASSLPFGVDPRIKRSALSPNGRQAGQNSTLKRARSRR